MARLQGFYVIMREKHGWRNSLPVPNARDLEEAVASACRFAAKHTPLAQGRRGSSCKPRHLP
jgi:hypothetical protein